MTDTVSGRAPSGQALAVPATPADAVDGPSGFDPSRTQLTIASLRDDGPTILRKMALRCEHYAAISERPLPTAPRMCTTCPFRGASAEYRKESALIPAQDWPCHTDESEHCAGHYAAINRFGATTPALIRLSAIAMEARQGGDGEAGSVHDSAAIAQNKDRDHD